jgi:hypothetical protein
VLKGVDVGSYGNGGGWAPYVSVAERRRKAERMVAALKKKGRGCQPVVTEGRAIARTFWGKNWCDNLESYSDYANRLARGRTYVRNGSVVDLQITQEKISALVAGSEVYEVSISVRPLEKTMWQAVLDECAGKIASLVELLQGRLSSAVMEVVTRHGSGLFPNPKHISFRCSCPDSASMCKHVAATLYGVGTRFDLEPELLFRLRHVDPQELILQAGSLPIAHPAPGIADGLAGADLSALFGIDLDQAPPAAAPSSFAPLAVAPARAGGASQKTPARANGGATGTKGAISVTASELSARAIPPHVRHAWLKSGVLLRTELRGVYGVTEQTESRVLQYLARAKAR